jgi:hypothetical protein
MIHNRMQAMKITVSWSLMFWKANRMMTGPDLNNKKHFLNLFLILSYSGTEENNMNLRRIGLLTKIYI